MKKFLLCAMAFTLLISPIILSMTAHIAYGQVQNAQNTRNCGGETADSGLYLKVINPLKACSIQELVFQLADIALTVGAVASVLVMIYAGFKFVMAQGSEDKIKDAKNYFFWAVVGIAVLFGAKLIAGIIQATIKSLQ
jgi:hypothetical protein